MHEGTNGTAGTYAKAVPCEATKERIANLINILNIRNSVATHSLHTTLVYSDVEIPLESYTLPEPIAAKPIGFTVFCTEFYNCLVILLDSIGLTTLHQHARAMGATYDYDQYHPHVTVSYDFQGSVPDNSILEEIGELIFNEVVVESLR